jgi:oxalate decarboxylase
VPTNPSEESNSNSNRKISRRDFLNFIGATGAIFTLSSLAPSAKAFASGANTTYTNNSQISASPQPTEMASTHVFNLDTALPQISNIDGGSRTIATADNFPIFNGNGMAAYLLRLKKGGVYEPHWHPNAAELSYCINGRAIMTIFSPNAGYDSFTIDPGELVFVPRGYIHDIENTGDQEAKFVTAFNYEQPQEIGISGSVGSMPDRVLNATFGIKPPTPTFFNGFNNNSPKDIVIGSKKANVLEAAATTATATSTPPANGMTRIPNPHKFNLEGIPPQVQTTGGTVALGNANTFPILNGLACYSLRLKPNGIREPHWHPNSAELDYVIEGRARMTILSPGGSVDTFDVSPGQIVFIPPAYFHYIENPDSINNMHFAVFFGHEKPEDIGISGALSAYSNEVLAAVFNLDPTYFDKLPKLEQDVFVVTGGA